MVREQRRDFGCATDARAQLLSVDLGCELQRGYYAGHHSQYNERLVRSICSAFSGLYMHSIDEPCGCTRL